MYIINAILVRTHSGPPIWINHAIISSGIKRFVGAEMTQSYWRFQLMWKEKKTRNRFSITIRDDDSIKTKIDGIPCAITDKHLSANEWRAPYSMAIYSFVIHIIGNGIRDNSKMHGIFERQPKVFCLQLIRVFIQNWNEQFDRRVDKI